jgi:Flp pilus assembly protein TadG
MTPPAPQPRLRHPANERAQALVEFVLGLPLLAFVLVTILQFGVVMNDYVEVAQAARSGARKASVSRRTTAPAAAADKAARGSASKLDQDRLAVDIEAIAGWRRGNPVSVEVSYPYEVGVFGVVVTNGTMTFKATARLQ